MLPRPPTPIPELSFQLGRIKGIKTNLSFINLSKSSSKDKKQDVSKHSSFFSSILDPKIPICFEEKLQSCYSLECLASSEKYGEFIE